MHHEASVPRAPLPPLLLHCSSRPQGESKMSKVVCELGMSAGVQPVDDGQGLCQDCRLWSRKVVWPATQAYDAQGNFVCKGMRIAVLTRNQTVLRHILDVSTAGGYSMVSSA